MGTYTEFNITLKPDNQEIRDIIIAQLSELGFDSFMEEDRAILAYIPTSELNRNPIGPFDQIELPPSISLSYTQKQIEEKNWNSIWEANFEPIIVDNRCLVRASFHTNLPDTEHEIIIDPRMAFGTGHHQTTYLMIRELLSLNLTGQAVLDMGCGTGILAILAEQLNAQKIVAIDNDSWAYENTLDNIANNGCRRVDVFHGDASLLNEAQFNLILANINLNVLLTDLESYRKALKENGKIIMSGFLESDCPTLIRKASRHGMQLANQATRNSWAILTFTKE